MGRLIDADKLMAEMKKAEAEPSYQHTGEDWYVGMVSAEGFIDEAETVEAIPVDWLLRKADWCDKNNGIFVSGAIRSAVDAWREEQNNVADKP